MQYHYAYNASRRETFGSFMEDQAATLCARPIYSARAGRPAVHGGVLSANATSAYDDPLWKTIVGMLPESIESCRSKGMPKPQNIIPAERIASRIYLMRGQKVMLDSDLAQLYGVPTMRLNEQFKRNRDRFPADFAFQMTKEEFESFDIAICDIKHGAGRTADTALGFHRTRCRHAFKRPAQQKAVQVNISIIRTFVKLCGVLATHKDLARKVELHDQQIAVLFDAVRKLLVPPNPPKLP